jgi:hypothetical protein
MVKTDNKYRDRAYKYPDEGFSIPARFLFILPLIFIGLNGYSQQVKEGPCADNGYSQFDFWIGDWDVFDRNSGKLVGTNSISRILGGCALEENWEGSGGSRGKSFNTYDPSEDLWTQTWVDNTGNRFVFKGRLVKGNMLLEGNYKSEEIQLLFKLSFFPDFGAGTVRQIWEQSQDNGQSWNTIFDGIYRRQKPRNH